MTKPDQPDSNLTQVSINIEFDGIPFYEIPTEELTFLDGTKQQQTVYVIPDYDKVIYYD
jgi:hypothetical protein